MSKTTYCNKCKKELLSIEHAIECQFCIERLIDENEENSDEENCKIIPPMLYCYCCYITCYACSTNGCPNCIESVCSDCSERMCPNCAFDGKPNCGCYGKCTSCYTTVDRGANGWPCNDCRQWLCNYCHYHSKIICDTCGCYNKSDEESSKESDEELFNCNECKKEFNKKDATKCKFCIKKYISDIKKNCKLNNVKYEPINPDDFDLILYCSNCSDSCYDCKISGCSNCIECVCCDCCVRMCPNCEGNGDENCGCYGTCSRCEKDIDRCENGWPCDTCKQWYCSRCIKINNFCNACKPDSDSE